MRIVAQLLVIIATAGLLIGCGDEPCAGQKSCAKIEVKAPSASAAPARVETKPAETKPAVPPPPPAKEPKAEETPAAEPAKEASKEKGKLIVVTNEANYEKDKDVINFIATRGVAIERISPADFDKYKSEKYILVLGGPGEGEGLGDIVKQLLSPDEVSFVSQMGNKELYLKTDKYSSGQQIIVIAGCDADATFRQFVNSKDKWWGYISSWFNIELSHDEVYGY
jgi:hypothetical protein